MLQTLVEARAPLALLCATALGSTGLHVYPFPVDNPVLQLIAVRAPDVFLACAYGYPTLWLATIWVASYVVLSLCAIVLYRHPRVPPPRPLPPYPTPELRDELSLVIGETHHLTTPGPAPNPTWLVIPRRGLYTGIMVIGATGTGKTSAAMLPFADQLFAWHADDPATKLAGLILEVKGDFCRDVQRILDRHGRAADYIEIGLQSNVSYNPLQSDLDAYSLSFAIATLINQLFGKSKEPFWQQAYTDLLRAVISLRRLADGYTTLAEVYRYILDEAQIDKEIRRLKGLLTHAPDVLRVTTDAYHLHCARAPWKSWYEHAPDAFAHPYDAELENYLAQRDVPYVVERAQGRALLARRHQLEAIERWYYQSWTRLDTRLRSSIVEGIVVFLGLFDSDPDVYRHFCPPRSAYVTGPAPDEPTPLPPLADLLERGAVLALNFPMAANPALGRILAVMLKLDFHRTMLQRIARITADPARIFRDVAFIADEYHQIATTGEAEPTGDERAFSMTRQARLIPIVAGPSLSTFRTALAGDESWRTLVQCFRTKVFLTTSDDFTAQIAADLCARRETLKSRYTLAEIGQGAHISLLSGKSTAAANSFTASKSYALQEEHIFPARAFMQLQNNQAIVLPFDGQHPLPPQYTYLKPYYRDPNIGFFDETAPSAT